ncbi:MAG: hypothetical protein ACQEXB_27975 [Bacillota bacterium]
MSAETAVLVRLALVEDTYLSTKVEKPRNYKNAEGVHILRGLRKKSTVNGQIVSQRIIRMSGSLIKNTSMRQRFI